MAGNIIFYTPIQGTNREQYFNHIIHRGKNADSGGNKTPFRPFLLSYTTSFPSFYKKMYESSPLEMDIRVLIPAPTL